MVVKEARRESAQQTAAGRSAGRQLGWVLAAAGFGFAVPALLSSLLKLPREWYLAPYAVGVVLFVAAWARSSGLDPAVQLRRRWVWGLAGTLVLGLFMISSVQRQPASAPPEGLALLLAIAWLGIVYGVVDALLLNVLPVLAVWQAFAARGATDRWPGRLAAGLVGLAASLFVTAAYHLGYAEYRGPGLVSPLLGNGIMTLGYLLTGSPLTAVGTHVVLHVASVLHGIDTTVTLPPHYP